MVGEGRPDELAAALRRLHEDRELAGLLALSGRAVVVARYLADAAADAFSDLFADLVDSRP